MKAIYHKQSEVYRVVQRGKLYYVQHKGDSHLVGMREYDAWHDIGKARTDINSALGAMYTRIPMHIAA